MSNNDKLVKQVTESVVAVTSDLNNRITNLEQMVAKIYDIVSEKKSKSSTSKANTAKSSTSTATTGTAKTSTTTKKAKVVVPKMIAVWFKKKYKEDTEWRKKLLENADCAKLFNDKITGFSADDNSETTLKSAWKLVNTHGKEGAKDALPAIVELRKKLNAEHEKERLDADK